MMDKLIQIYKYLSNNNTKNGEIVSLVINDLCKLHSFENVLFIRTPTTGEWLDHIYLPHNIYLKRILYNSVKHSTKHHPATIVINQDNIQQSLLKFFLDNKTYDLICIDPFHEYNPSFRDLTIF